MKRTIINNLIIYIILLIVIICIFFSLTSYFYKNMRDVNDDVSVYSDYAILNLYLLRTIKSGDVTIQNYGLVDNDDTLSYYITFLKEDGSMNTFIKKNDMIYFNKIKLCENVQEFKIFVDRSEKESISVEVKIANKTYNLQYVLN